MAVFTRLRSWRTLGRAKNKAQRTSIPDTIKRAALGKVIPEPEYYILVRANVEADFSQKRSEDLAAPFSSRRLIRCWRQTHGGRGCIPFEKTPQRTKLGDKFYSGLGRRQ